MPLTQEFKERSKRAFSRTGNSGRSSWGRCRVSTGRGSRDRKGDPSRLYQRDRRVRRVESSDQTARNEPAHAGSQRQSAGSQSSRADQSSPESRGTPLRGVAPRRRLRTQRRGTRSVRVRMLYSRLRVEIATPSWCLSIIFDLPSGLSRRCCPSQARCT
jgi:hypothetical protein